MVRTIQPDVPFRVLERCQAALGDATSEERDRRLGGDTGKFPYTKAELDQYQTELAKLALFEWRPNGAP